jgi:hypothetical protein
MRTTLRVTLALAAVHAAAANAAAQGGAPEPDGFRYYWPGACMEAVYRSDGYYWRARRDTARHDPAADTMLTASRGLARECAARFASAALESRDFVPLAALYLAAGNDTAASATVARRLALPDMRVAGARAWVLADMVDMYLRASPARVDAARARVKQLDAMTGSDGALGQVRSHHALAVHYARVANDSAAIAEAEATIAAGKRLSARDRQEYAGRILSAYHMMATIAGARTGDAATPRAIIARARADLSPLRRVDAEIDRADTAFAMYGTRAAPIQSTLRLGVPADSLLPAPGRVNLLVFTPMRENIPAFRRIASRFAEGVQFVFVQGSYGYFRALGPLTFDEERAQLQRHYVDELGIPGVMLLTEASFYKIPDGRRVRQPTGNDRAYRTYTGVSVVLVDRAGIIRRMWLGWQGEYELEIERAVERALGTG